MPMAKPNQIAGAYDPDEMESHGKGVQKRSQTKSGKSNMTCACDCEAYGSRKRVRPALCRAGLEKQKHVWPRNKKISSQCACV